MNFQENKHAIYKMNLSGTVQKARSKTLLSRQSRTTSFLGKYKKVVFLFAFLNSTILNAQTHADVQVSGSSSLADMRSVTDFQEFGDVFAIKVDRGASRLGITEEYRKHFLRNRDADITKISDDQIIAMIIELNNPFGFGAISPTTGGLQVREGSWAVLTNPTHVKQIEPIHPNLKGELIRGTLLSNLSDRELITTDELQKSFIAKNRNNDYSGRLEAISEYQAQSDLTEADRVNFYGASAGLFPSIATTLSEGDFRKAQILVSTSLNNNLRRRHPLGKEKIIDLKYDVTNTSKSTQYFCLEVDIVKSTNCDLEGDQSCIDNKAAERLHQALMEDEHLLTLHPIFSESELTVLSESDAEVICKDRRAADGSITIVPCDDESKIGCSDKPVGFRLMNDGNQQGNPKPLKVDFLVLNLLARDKVTLVDHFSINLERSTVPIKKPRTDSNPPIFNTLAGIDFILIRILNGKAYRLAFVSQVDGGPFIQTWDFNDVENLTSTLRNKLDFRIMPDRGRAISRLLTPTLLEYIQATDTCGKGLEFVYVGEKFSSINPVTIEYITRDSAFLGDCISVSHQPHLSKTSHLKKINRLNIYMYGGDEDTILAGVRPIFDKLVKARFGRSYISQFDSVLGIKKSSIFPKKRREDGVLHTVNVYSSLPKPDMRVNSNDRYDDVALSIINIHQSEGLYRFGEQGQFNFNQSQMDRFHSKDFLLNACTNVAVKSIDEIINFDDIDNLMYANKGLDPAEAAVSSFCAVEQFLALDQCIPLNSWFQKVKQCMARMDSESDIELSNLAPNFHLGFHHIQSGASEICPSSTSSEDKHLK